MPQKILMTLRPEKEFDIPFSEGYQLYSAILAAMQEGDKAAASHAHDSPIGSISLGPLKGALRRSQRARHNALDPAQKYSLEIGIPDPKEEEIFRALIQPLVLRETNLCLEKGELRVEELASSTASFEDLVKPTAGLQEPCIDLQFISAACIPYRNSRIYEMFPHREAVFHSLLSKWNAVCPEELRMNIERDEMARYIIELPLAYDTRSVVVNTVFDRKKGHARPIMRQGFVGRCQYRFTKDAPASFRNGIAALARFAEYSGLGSAVARGCGAVRVTVGEVR